MMMWEYNSATMFLVALPSYHYYPDSQNLPTSVENLGLMQSFSRNTQMFIIFDFFFPKRIANLKPR
jgi:hypothetical protein